MQRSCFSRVSSPSRLSVKRTGRTGPPGRELSPAARKKDNKYSNLPFRLKAESSVLSLKDEKEKTHSSLETRVDRRAQLEFVLFMVLNVPFMQKTLSVFCLVCFEPCISFKRLFKCKPDLLLAYVYICAARLDHSSSASRRGL